MRSIANLALNAGWNWLFFKGIARLIGHLGWQPAFTRLDNEAETDMAAAIARL